MALDRIRLAGQQRLVDEEVLGFQHLRIGGNQVARRQQHHIARHQIGGGALLRLAVAQHLHLQRHLGGQLLRRLARTVLLHKVEDDGQQHHHHDHAGAGGVARGGRYGAGHQQHQHQRVAKAREELQHQALAPGLELVGAELQQARCRFAARQAQGRLRRRGEGTHGYANGIGRRVGITQRHSRFLQCRHGHAFRPGGSASDGAHR